MIHPPVVGRVVTLLCWVGLCCLPAVAQPANPWSPPIGIPAPPFGINETAPPSPKPWARPTPGFYYVDASKPNASDANNTWGTPSLPRRTIPPDLPAGSVVELRGVYASSHTSPKGITAAGTAARPVFIRGASAADRPRVTGSWEVDGSYLVVEHVEFAFTEAVKGAFTFLAPADHVVLRHCDVHGNPAGGGIALASYSSASSSYLVLYANKIHDNGDADANYDQDVHGIVVGGSMSHVWVLDNEMYRNSGDGLQINSGGSSHHIYVGRNQSHHNKQNGLWTKRAVDVVFSENLAYAHRSSDSAFGAGLGMQYGPERVWFLFNHVHGCDTGIGVASDTGDGKDGKDVYMIGNVIHGVGSSANPGSAWTPAGILLAGIETRHVVNNTIHDVATGVAVPRGGAVHLVNNVISGINQAEGSHVFIEGASAASSSTLHHDLLEGPVRIKWGDAGNGMTLFGLQSSFPGRGANCLDKEPGYQDVHADDFRLQAGSPAVDAGTEYPAYATFLEMYGIDIRQDAARTPRPQGAAMDLGAYERLP